MAEYERFRENKTEEYEEMRERRIELRNGKGDDPSHKLKCAVLRNG